jgi:hypothetical protein
MPDARIGGVVDNVDNHGVWRSERQPAHASNAKRVMTKLGWPKTESVRLFDQPKNVMSRGTTHIQYRIN